MKHCPSVLAAGALMGLPLLFQELTGPGVLSELHPYRCHCVPSGQCCPRAIPGLSQSVGDVLPSCSAKVCHKTLMVSPVAHLNWALKHESEFSR